MSNTDSKYTLNRDPRQLTSTACLLSHRSDVVVTILGLFLSAGGDPQIDAKRSETPSKRDELLTTATQFFEQQDVTQFFTMTFAKRVLVEKARTRFMEWIDGLNGSSVVLWVGSERKRQSVGPVSVLLLFLYTFTVCLLPPHISTSRKRSSWDET